MSATKATKAPLRITFPVRDIAQGKMILEHLTEERLVAGGTVIHAEALNWVGGEVREKGRREVTAYTTYEKLPILKSRVGIFFESHGEAPVISQFVMAGERESTLGWIERNTQN